MPAQEWVTSFLQSNGMIVVIAQRLVVRFHPVTLYPFRYLAYFQWRFLHCFRCLYLLVSCKRYFSRNKYFILNMLELSFVHQYIQQSVTVIYTTRKYESWFCVYLYHMSVALDMPAQELGYLVCVLMVRIVESLSRWWVRFPPDALTAKLR